VIDDDFYRTSIVKYRGGQRYPHLERKADTPDYLGELINPRAGK